jgi:hypothetical protein
MSYMTTTLTVGHSDNNQQWKRTASREWPSQVPPAMSVYTLLMHFSRQESTQSPLLHDPIGMSTQSIISRRRLHADNSVYSSSQYPDAVQTRCIDFNRHETIVEALRDQDALIITLSGRSPFQELEAILVRAAGDAGMSREYAFVL